MAARKRPASSGSTSEAPSLQPFIETGRYELTPPADTSEFSPPLNKATASQGQDRSDTKRRALGAGSTPSPRSTSEETSFFENTSYADRASDSSSSSNLAAFKPEARSRRGSRNLQPGTASKESSPPEQNDSPHNGLSRSGRDASRSSDCSDDFANHVDDSLQGLYFAPMALVVLDHNRTIKMLSKSAEAILGIRNSICKGHHLERYLPSSTKQALAEALDEASERSAKSSARSTTPFAAHIEIHATEGYNWADLAISAWYPRGVDIDSAGKPVRLAHEASFTISITPSIRGIESIESAKPIEAKQQSKVVNEFIVNQLDLAILALDKEGKNVGRNKAASRVWSVLGEKESEDTTDLIQDEEDLEWVQQVAYITDENFDQPISSDDFPIYKSAILGEVVPPMLMGVESKHNGDRFIFEVVGHPVHDSVNGEHIGGVITFRNVTADREQLKKEAEEQADRFFKQTCNAMPQLVFVTSSIGTEEWYSDSWYKFSGASQDVADTEGWITYMHPDDVSHAISQWTAAVEDGSLFEAPLRIRRHDGEYRWFQCRALPMKDATGKVEKWFGTCTDINDHAEALSASRGAQNQLESVIHHANVTIWAVDKEGIITLAKGPGVRQLKLTAPSPQSGSDIKAQDQDSASASTSQTKTTIVGRSIYDVWESSNIEHSMKQALNGETTVTDMQIDGRWFRTSYTPMRAHSDEMNSLVGHQRSDIDFDADISEKEIIGVVGASLDITDRKEAQARMENSLVEKTRAMAAEDAAREASRLKSEFLANMSHEIRTPIAGVIGLAELLLDEKGLTELVREYAETIQSSAEGLLTVINDVLDFSKVEVGRLEVEKVPFLLHAPLMDAKRLFSFATQKKGLAFKEDINIKYDGQVIGDRGRVKQVLTNLLTNAIKFTSEGYISLEATEVSEGPGILTVRFDVRDTGCGISPLSLSRLFQPFMQADASTARRFGGTGLGLSISKNLVELMNGEIGLESVENQGSHAWFSIPFVKASAKTDKEVEVKYTQRPVIARLNSTRSDGGKEEIIPKPREDIWILIAEDNVVNARIASKYVERMGFNCQVAENGLLALQELNRKKYDIVLMDCQMPECDGYQATRILRQSTNAEIRILPVVALTASAIKGDRERALDAGMVDYLSKPVKRSALEATLCKWLFDDETRQELGKYLDAPFSTKDASGVVIAGQVE